MPPVGSHCDTLLAVFAKHGQPGMVKTRLAAAIGNEPAAAIHQVFLETLLGRFAHVADRRLLVYSPPEAEPAMSDLAGTAWGLAPQGDGDLGRRMQRFFTETLLWAKRVVLIGADSPDLPPAYLEQAFDALRTHDVVLGPASDGGYYLVGAARAVPPIFAGMPWSTSAVWEQTVAQLAKCGARWHELPRWHDVDDEDGLASLLTRLRDFEHADPALPRLLLRLRQVLPATGEARLVPLANRGL